MLIESDAGDCVMLVDNTLPEDEVNLITSQLNTKDDPATLE